MTSRRISLAHHDEPDPNVIAWVEANGLDPFDLPAAQEALVEDGHITVCKFVRNAEGHKVINPGGWVEKELVTVPLISAPENHSL